MNSMRERLGQAIWRGALLSAVVATACGGKSGEDDQQNTTGSGGSAGKGNVASGGTGAVGLPLLPSGDYPACSGETHDGGYFGQCCVSPHCYTPTSGGCAPASDVSQLLPEFPPGSGECSCIPEAGEGQAVVGPYHGRPEVTPVSAGECCYLVGSISCTGRPLLVAGVPRVASLRSRADWARRSAWAPET
jgi:hypothetical protein